MDDTVNTEHLERCITILERSYIGLLQQDKTKDQVLYDVYRHSVVKSFEIIIEQSAKLLRKVLKPYFASSKDVYKLSYKQIFKYALQHSLLEQDLVERWFTYHDNRNSTSHDYGEYFANETIKLVEQCIKDAKILRDVIEQS